MSLQDYYELEWLKTCPQSESFLASWQGLALYSHSLLIVFLPIYIFTTYCIIYKTPKTMSSVKRALLNSHFWCCFMDIMVCSLITPYFYLPAIAGFPVGLMTVMGIPTSAQTYIGLVTVMLLGHSLTALFENRSSSIPSNRFRMTKTSTRVVFYSINCLMAIGYLIPPLLNVPEQEKAKISLLQDIPCPTEEFFYGDIFVLVVDTDWKNYFWISLSLLIIINIIQISFFFFCGMYYLFISTSLVISERTKKLQRHFFLGTVAQVIVPLTCMVIPASCIIWSIVSGYYNQEFNNLCVILLAVHGFMADIIILLVHNPYRTFIFHLVDHARGSIQIDSNIIKEPPISDGMSTKKKNTTANVADIKFLRAEIMTRSRNNSIIF